MPVHLFQSIGQLLKYRSSGHPYNGGINIKQIGVGEVQQVDSD
jgi:hypothetical protein